MAKIFTKKELIAAVAKETGLTQINVAAVFEASSKVQKAKLKAGYIVRCPNGQIKIISRKARKGINPQTGRKISIPASKKPKFVFSKEFKKGY